MSVSSTFFNAITTYSNSRTERTLGDTLVPSRAWQYHPLNWNCKDQTAFSLCFPKANVAKEFFQHLLQPLESHYGNCKEVIPKSRYTWSCPSNHDPDDVLSLHVHPDIGMGFESLKGSGKCWPLPAENPPSPYVDEQRSFTCKAWNFLEKPDHLLQFETEVFANGQHPSVIEHGNEGEINAIDGTSFPLLDKNRSQARLSRLSQFSRFIHQSENLEEWQRDVNKNGLLKAFVAATTSESAPSKPGTPSTTTSYSIPVSADSPKIEPFACPTPESANCPPCSGDANTNNDPTQSNGFAFGLISGVIGTAAAVSAFVLSRGKKNKAQPSELPAPSLTSKMDNPRTLRL
jgi:hypothetical protein